MWAKYPILLLLILSMIGTVKAPVILTINQHYDFETGNIGGLNSSMDVKCERVLNPGISQRIQAVNGARITLNYLSPTPFTNPNNLIGAIWTKQPVVLESSGTGNYQGVRTNEDNYVKLYSASGTFNECQFTAPGISEFSGRSDINNTPFFNGTNYANIFTNGQKAVTFQTNDTIYAAIDYQDLGIYNNSDMNINTFDVTLLPRGFDVFVDTYYSTTKMLNTTSRSSFAQILTYPDTQITYLQISANCGALASANTTADFTTLNILGINLLCNYNFVPAGFAGAFMVNETTTTKGDPDSVRPDFRINIAFYNTSIYNIITSVSYTPANPQANQTVTVTFSSSLQSNGSVFFRYRNVTAGNGESNYTSWFSLSNTTLYYFGYLHKEAINASYIFDGKFYQYYVASGSATNNNTNAFYNFTVGALGSSINPSGAFGSVTGSEESGFCSDSACVYMWGVIIFAVFTLVSWHFGGDDMGKAVALTSLTIESLVGLLPQLLIVPIIVLTALAIAKMFGWIGGSGNV